MYLDYFRMKDFPFSLTPNVEYFCNLKGPQEALNTLLFSLRSGEGFIKIIGEVGSGKTLLCRKLLNSLDSEFVTAYIPNPDLNSNELRNAFAREIGLESSLLHDQHELLTKINHQLLKLHHENKRVVLLIDEAQALPLESLETLRLLTNLETETTKLLQVVLFAQPELDDYLQKPNMRQLKQRITFSFYLPLLSREDLDTYLFHRLSKAGCICGSLFTKKALNLLYRASSGTPRLVNILCHKALLVAYGKGEEKINHRIMRLAVSDTESTISFSRRSLITWVSGIGIFIFLFLASLIYKGFI